MNISARCEYACRALVELSLLPAGGTITSGQIADRRHIPEKYLVHIMLQLKRVGLVRSVRGAQGGYHLSRPATEITLLDIVQAIDGPILHPLPVNDEWAEQLRPAWQDIGKSISSLLRGITLQDITHKASLTHMYYI
jgi:Rrf2 family protein